jgi:hypothetical protein
MYGRIYRNQLRDRTIYSTLMHQCHRLFFFQQLFFQHVWYRFKYPVLWNWQHLHHRIHLRCLWGMAMCGGWEFNRTNKVFSSCNNYHTFKLPRRTNVYKRRMLFASHLCHHHMLLPMWLRIPTSNSCLTNCIELYRLYG